MKGFTVEEYDKIAAQAREIFVKKSQLYGECESLGVKAEFVQIYRKYIRLKKMIWDNDFTGYEQEFNDTIEDTVLDLMNYCFIFLHVYRNEKE